MTASETHPDLICAHCEQPFMEQLVTLLSSGKTETSRCPGGRESTFKPLPPSHAVIIGEDCTAMHSNAIVMGFGAKSSENQEFTTKFKDGTVFRKPLTWEEWLTLYHMFNPENGK